MDQLLKSRYHDFDLTCMDEYGDGITVLESREKMHSLKYKRIKLFDSNKNASNIRLFLKLNDLGKLQRDIVINDTNDNVYHYNPKIRYGRDLSGLVVRLDRENVSNLPSRGSYSSGDISITKDFDIQAVAHIASLVTGSIEIENKTGHSVRIFGPLFKHCKAESITLNGINLDKSGFESIRVEEIVLSGSSNPYVTYSKCKKLVIASNAMSFSPFPITVESLEISNVPGICTVAILPRLTRLSISNVNELILFDLPKLRSLKIDSTKLYAEDDILDNLTELESGRYNSFLVNLLERCTNISVYKTVEFDPRLSHYMGNVTTLEVKRVRKIPSVLPPKLRTFIADYEYDIADILDIAPKLRQITFNDSVLNVNIDRYPMVEFLDIVGKYPYIEAHNEKARKMK